MARAELPNELMRQLQEDEGLRLTAYPDTAGHWTVGYGHTPAHEGMTWTLEQARDALRADAAAAADAVDTAFPWANKLGPVRRAVLVNMAFNMGIARLRGFRKALTAAQEGDYQACAAHMLDSLWARQVKGRAKRLAQQMRTNEWGVPGGSRKQADHQRKSQEG